MRRVRSGMNLYRPSTMAALLVFASCSQPQPAEPTLPPPPKTEEVVVVEPPPPPPAPEAEPPASINASVGTPTTPDSESAFDSNQWNSTLGLGGGAGGAYGGRAPRMISAESYAKVAQSGFLAADLSPMSTFAADVDTASFTNVLRQLNSGRLQPDSVRLEEFVNAMRYELDAPGPRETFAIDTEVAPCPWNDAHELVRVSIRTQTIETDKLPPCNLVFLVDISGSMSARDKLPLLKRAFGLLVDQMRPQDRVSIVTYASGVRVALDSASGSERGRIHDALAALRTRGGTNGQGGIQAAYELATKNKVHGVNRVLLATDGDFNVGIRSADELEAFITEKKKLGVFLSVLGFGTGNLKDDRLERLANRGDGVYSYIDDVQTARRVLVEQFGASMMTVAKDVKLQTEWHKDQVKQYRLLGYENRALATKDFTDDNKDGGEVGAGHSVTALYEIERAEQPGDAKGPLATLRIRYKPPHGDTSREVSEEILPAKEAGAELSANGRLAATAAALAMHLRNDEHRGSLSEASVEKMVQALDAQAHPELHQMLTALKKRSAASASGSSDH